METCGRCWEAQLKSKRVQFFWPSQSTRRGRRARDEHWGWEKEEGMETTVAGGTRSRASPTAYVSNDPSIIRLIRQKKFHTRTLLCTAPEGERNLQIFRGHAGFNLHFSFTRSRRNLRQRETGLARQNPRFSRFPSLAEKLRVLLHFNV